MQLSTDLHSCPAALRLRGVRFGCDQRSHPHPGVAHSNRVLRARWVDERDEARP